LELLPGGKEKREGGERKGGGERREETPKAPRSWKPARCCIRRLGQKRGGVGGQSAGWALVHQCHPKKGKEGEGEERGRGRKSADSRLRFNLSFLLAQEEKKGGGEREEEKRVKWGCLNVYFHILGGGEKKKRGKRGRRFSFCIKKERGLTHS